MPDYRALLLAYMREVYEDDAVVAVRCAEIAPELDAMMLEIRRQFAREHGEREPDC